MIEVEINFPSSEIVSPKKRPTNARMRLIAATAKLIADFTDFLSNKISMIICSTNIDAINLGQTI